MKRIGRILAGISLCVAGLAGAFYSSKALRAQIVYHHVRYGSLKAAPAQDIIDRCQKSYALYPHNYYLCARAARAFTNDARQAQIWLERGLAANNYNFELRHQKAELLSHKHPGEAVLYWQDYLDWQFWSAPNLSLMVKYQAHAGQLEDASELLSLLKGHAGYKSASAALQRAIMAEMMPPAAQ